MDFRCQRHSHKALRSDMVRPIAALAMFIASVHLLVVSAQSMDGQKEVLLGSGPMPTPSAVLQLHHVALDSESLVAALKSPEPLVRGLAAVVLAENGDAGAIPPMKESLARESDQQARINIAKALAELRDSDGIAALRSVCLDTKALQAYRLEAAMEIRPYSRDCLASVADIAWSSPEPDVRLEALNQLQREKEPLRGHEGSLLALEIHALNDSNPTVRMVAADGLAKAGDPSVLPLLRQKMEGESDGTVKSRMQRDIGALAGAAPK